MAGCFGLSADLFTDTQFLIYALSSKRLLCRVYRFEREIVLERLSNRVKKKITLLKILLFIQIRPLKYLCINRYRENLMPNELWKKL
jgi:hypothetical protein